MFLSLLKRRYSVRKYLAKPVEKEKLVKIIEAARLAPSACNSQGWRFIIVDDKPLIKQIVTQALGGIVANQWASTAPVIIVGCYEKKLIPNIIGEKVKLSLIHI